jgi:hypothetical protein
MRRAQLSAVLRVPEVRARVVRDQPYLFQLRKRGILAPFVNAPEHSEVEQVFVHR